MHLKQPELNCSACEALTKNKERIEKFNETRDANYIYKNELDKACLQHDVAYGNFKDLARRTTSDKFLRIKHLILQKILNKTDIKGGWLLWFTNILIKSQL